MPPERRAAEALLGRIEIDQPSIVAEPVTVRLALSRHEPPKSCDAIEALARAVAPLRLPAELRTLWEKVALGTSQGLRVEPYPRLKSPEFALEHWDSMRPILGEIVPPNLFVLVGYESHGCMSVELDMDGVQGGALFDWFISSPGGYVRRYNHLSEWLEDITAAVERGAYKRSEHADGMWLIIPNSYQPDQYGETGPLAGPHPNYHSPYVNDGDWPQHWRDAADMFRFGE